MIRANNLSLQYPDGTFGLQNINVEISSGEIVYLTGPSGSGKTSFLKLLMGMEYPTSGSLEVLGQDISINNKNNIQVLRRIIGPVFQDFKLLAGRTVLENVEIGMRFLDFSNIEMKTNAIISIDKVGLHHKADSIVDNLSFGERQRVAIARAVARKPKLIIADEPTGNLDIKNSLNIMDILTSFSNEDTTVIITTHATHLISDKKLHKRIGIVKGIMTVEEAKYAHNV